MKKYSNTRFALRSINSAKLFQVFDLPAVKISEGILSKLYRVILLILLLLAQNSKAQSPVPEGFVEVRKIIPDIILDLRYNTNHNFIGKPIDGYNAYKCYMTLEAAEALRKVQIELRKFSLSLKIYDAYRPQKAVDHFVRWANDLDDTLTKKEFYPTVDKERLFLDGYIATKSGHSRGSTVDLTIVPIPALEQPAFDINDQCECYLQVELRFKDNSLDMGTGFDCFNVLSSTENPALAPDQRVNRLLLKSLMEKYGFRNLAEEWWHYTLINEPFPDTYFNFNIE